MKTTNLSLCLLLIQLTVFSQSKSNYSNEIDQFKGEISKVVSSGAVRGMSIAVIHGNNIIWSDSFGFSDYEKGIKADSNTLYGFRTGTNLLTSTAIMQLHNSRKLNIDTSLSEYIPSFRIKNREGNQQEITLRMLLSHRSGLPTDIARDIYSSHPLSFRSVSKLVQKEYAPFPADCIHLHSNIGYSLLGMVIENVSKQGYESYLTSHIFSPLNMNSTCFSSGKSELLSKGYDKTSKLRCDYAMSSDESGIMIKSNITDMAKFLMTFLPSYTGKSVLSREMVKEMIANQSNDSPLDLNQKYGLTWIYERINSAGQIYYHVSKSLNHRCLFVMAPESDLAVVILSNSVNSWPLHGIAMNILDQFAIKSGSKPYESVSAVNQKCDTISAKDNVLFKYTGVYCNPKSVIGVRSKKGRLYAEVYGNKFVMTPLDDGSFGAQVVLPNNKLNAVDHIRFEFTSIEGKDLFLYHDMLTDQRKMLGVKILPGAISSIWMDRIGIYEIYQNKVNDFPNPPVFELAVEDSIMVLKVIEHSNKWNTALSVKDDNTAFTMGVGRQIGSTLLFEKEKGKEILWFSGIKLIRVKN